MTRDFNKQRRDDMRPSSRYQSPNNRYREEQPARPARPRLNREIVDRAWESGARPDHPDYRTRANDNRRYGQYSDHSSTHLNGRKPFVDRQGNQRPRSQPFNSATRYNDDQPFNDRRGPQSRPGWNNSRPDYRDRGTTHYPGQRPGPGYHDRDYNRNDERGGFNRNGRPPRDYDRGSNRPPRYAPQGDRNQQNPRWQSRPWAQRDDSPRRSQDFGSAPRYEGDYERFDAHDAPRRPPNRPPQQRRPERPFTGPRGRGYVEYTAPTPTEHAPGEPRSGHRKDPEFWAEISDEAEGLVEQVTPPPIDPKADQPALYEKGKSRVSRKPGSRPTRSRKKANEGSGPRPSQRGYKWPTP